MKALIVRGGWGGHEPLQTSEIAARELREAGVEVELAETLDAFRDASKLKQLDLIVPIWTMGTIEKEQLEPLLAAVRAGVGLGGWHGGMCDAFRQQTEYQFMTGGQWVSHPGGDKAHYRVRIGPQPSPITSGLADFYVTSEQYYMHVDPGVTVLATTHVAPGAAGGDGYDPEAQAAVDADRVPGVPMPVTWTKRYGKGRVFYTSLGHVARVFEIPEAVTMLRRGLLWAAGAPLP
ncbi:MAG TPA: ThuA domain-containing protein [Chloroflexota bacterium]|nr:ThuA domain-containing protein [Chloroflexota bacterium]